MAQYGVRSPNCYVIFIANIKLLITIHQANYLQTEQVLMARN